VLRKGRQLNFSTGCIYGMIYTSNSYLLFNCITFEQLQVHAKEY